MTLKKRYIQVADKKDYFLSCNFKWESQAHQSLRLRTFLFGSVTGCEKSTTGSPQLALAVTTSHEAKMLVPACREPLKSTQESTDKPWARVTVRVKVLAEM